MLSRTDQSGHNVITTSNPHRPKPLTSLMATLTSKPGATAGSSTPDTTAAGLFAEALKLQMRDTDAAEAASVPRMPEKKRQILPPIDAAQAATLAALVLPAALPVVPSAVAPVAKAGNADQPAIELAGIQLSLRAAMVTPAEVFAAAAPIAPGFIETAQPSLPADAELETRPAATATETQVASRLPGLHVAGDDHVARPVPAGQALPVDAQTDHRPALLQQAMPATATLSASLWTPAPVAATVSPVADAIPALPALVVAPAMDSMPAASSELAPVAVAPAVTSLATATTQTATAATPEAPTLTPQVAATTPQPSMTPQAVAATPQPSMTPQAVATTPQPSMPPQAVATTPQPSMTPQAVATTPQPSMTPQAVATTPQPSMTPQAVATTPQPSMTPQAVAATPQAVATSPQTAAALPSSASTLAALASATQAAKPVDAAGAGASRSAVPLQGSAWLGQPLTLSQVEQVATAAPTASAAARPAARPTATAEALQVRADPAGIRAVVARAVEAVPAAEKLLTAFSQPETPVNALDRDQPIDTTQFLALQPGASNFAAAPTERPAVIGRSPELAAEPARANVDSGRLQLQMQSAELGPMSLDMALDAAGHAHLIVHAATESLALSLGERTGQLVDAMRDMGLTVQVDVRQGGSQAGFTGGGAAGQQASPDANRAGAAPAEPRALPIIPATPRRPAATASGALSFYA